MPQAVVIINHILGNVCLIISTIKEDSWTAKVRIIIGQSKNLQ